MHDYRLAQNRINIPAFSSEFSIVFMTLGQNNLHAATILAKNKRKL